MLFEHKCKQCGVTSFFHPSQLTHPRTGPRLYCSMDCRDEANSRYNATPCKWCGGMPKKRAYTFCSSACRGSYQKALKLKKGQKMSMNYRKEKTWQTSPST
jgi:hypothetical protein